MAVSDRDAHAAHMAHAIEHNNAEFLLAMGRAGGGAERADPEIRWIIGGSPIDYHNCVVSANLTPDTADHAIAASMEQMRARGVPGTWHVGPSMRPTDLGARLLRHGFHGAGGDAGMAMELSAVPVSWPVPSGLTIEPVQSEADLHAFAHVLAQGFGEGPREANWVADIFARMGLTSDAPIRHLVGWLDGEPVATATLYITGDVGGLYFISTAPALRRRGIGAAITLAALHDAASLGCHVAVLGASEIGYTLYERLGFREFCRITLYEWRPPGAAQA